MSLPAKKTGSEESTALIELFVAVVILLAILLLWLLHLVFNQGRRRVVVLGRGSRHQ